MFAVIKTGGKQYRVAAEDTLKIDRVAGEVGQIVEIGRVLAHGEGDHVTIGSPFVEDATVTAEVVEQGRGPKVIAFKKRRRKNSKRKRGYRDEITVIRVTEILTDGKAPSIGPRPKKEKKVEAAATEGDAPAKAAKKAPAKKAAAKQAAKKAAPKAAAKKAPAKKAAPKAKSDKK
jgi:large subunit ribosomal protein L21